MCGSRTTRAIKNSTTRPRRKGRGKLKFQKVGRTLARRRARTRRRVLTPQTVRKNVGTHQVARVVALGLLFFMFDERARLHELANDEWLIDTYGSAPFGLRNWNDLIVICYGIGGLACLLIWLKPVFREGRTRSLLILGFLFFWRGFR